MVDSREDGQQAALRAMEDSQTTDAWVYMAVIAPSYEYPGAEPVYRVIDDSPTDIYARDMDERLIHADQTARTVNGEAGGALVELLFYDQEHAIRRYGRMYSPNSASALRLVTAAMQFDDEVEQAFIGSLDCEMENWGIEVQGEEGYVVSRRSGRVVVQTQVQYHGRNPLHQEVLEW